MAVTQNEYVGDGVTTLFPFTFPYITADSVKVSLNGIITTQWTFANLTTVEMNEAPRFDVKVRVYRDTPDEELAATFYPGASVRAQDLNDDFEQLLYITQEVETFVENADLEYPIELAQEAIDIANEAKGTAEEAKEIAEDALEQVQRTQGLIIQDNEPSVGVKGTIWVNTSEDPPKIFVYDGAEWVESSGGGGSISVGANPPEEPEVGDLWYSSDDGRTYIWYEDINSSQWVDASPDGGNVTISANPPDPTFIQPGDLYWNNVSGVLYIWYNDGNSSQWVAVSELQSNEFDSIVLLGASYGSTRLNVPAAGENNIITFPGDAGTDGAVLTTDGGGVTSWTVPTSTPALVQLETVDLSNKYFYKFLNIPDNAVRITVQVWNLQNSNNDQITVRIGDSNGDHQTTDAYEGWIEKMYTGVDPYGTDKGFPLNEPNVSRGCRGQGTLTRMRFNGTGYITWGYIGQQVTGGTFNNNLLGTGAVETDAWGSIVLHAQSGYMVSGAATLYYEVA